MLGLIRILGVDDNARNLDILRRTLAPEFPIATAASGEEALEVAVKLRPDLILLDIMMPGIDGYETCRRIRAIPELACTKIIMVSAKALTAERLQGYAAGANDYVVKPFDPDELIAKVRVYLKLKSVEEVDRIKGDLLDLLSHDTGTPLTGILGALYLLRDSTEPTEEQRELIDAAESSAVRMQALVHRVSMVARLKAGRMPVEIVPVNLRALVLEVAEEATAAAAARGVLVRVQPGEELPVESDATLVSWVLHALVDNAVRVSPRGSMVMLDAGGAVDGTLVTVTDRGPGIETELLPRIFDEFVVADIRHYKRGSGLSLAAARLIATRLGANLSVTSEPGQGTTFRMSFPPAKSLLRAAA
jgi:two-component system sensor histidine kinase/response regulator